jgi:hypothetical protein
MEHGAVIEAVFHVLQEVLNGFRRVVRVKLEDNRAHRRFEFHFRVVGERGWREQEGG